MKTKKKGREEKQEEESDEEKEVYFQSQFGWAPWRRPTNLGLHVCSSEI